MRIAYLILNKKLGSKNLILKNALKNFNKKKELAMKKYKSI